MTIMGELKHRLRARYERAKIRLIIRAFKAKVFIDSVKLRFK